MPENHPISPSVDIELGGQVRQFKFDNNALIAIEEATGRNVLEQPLPAKMSAKELRLYAWAALLHSDSQLKIETVGSWLNMGNTILTIQAIAQALSAALPKMSEEDGIARPSVQ